jgi:hypothetical protein
MRGLGFRLCLGRRFKDLSARAERSRRHAIKHQPWLYGRIGAVENRIHTELCMAKDGEATTGQLVSAIYQNPVFDLFGPLLFWTPCFLF